MSEKNYAVYTSVLDIEEQGKVIIRCPIFRGCYVNREDCFKNGEVIPKDKCIGCMICTKYSDKIKNESQ